MPSQAILKIDKSGQPIRWISKEAATNLVCNGKVLWAFGEESFILFLSKYQKNLQNGKKYYSRQDR